MLTQGADDRNAGAAPYLAAFARVLGAHHLLTGALAEPSPGPRQALAAAHVARILPRHAADLAAARDGADTLYALSPEALG